MEVVSKSHKARTAIRKFKTLSDSVMLRGYYRPSGRTGEKLIEALMQIEPEIYGSMGDSRVVELKGLEYVIDRMPKGIESCHKLTMTGQEDFQDTAFEEIIPLKRRRVSYAIAENELCFVITRGESEIYDILTHITFLIIESKKILHKVYSREDGIAPEWKSLEQSVNELDQLTGQKLDKALWNLANILGRTYRETRDSYEYLEKNKLEKGTNNGLFSIIYNIGRRMIAAAENTASDLTLHFTPSLQEMIGHHRYASLWASSLKEYIVQNGLYARPFHIISANMHSVKNVLYGAAALSNADLPVSENIYDMVAENRDQTGVIDEYAEQHGCHFHNDESGSNINVQIIDTLKIEPGKFHKKCSFDEQFIKKERPVLLVMDYAFGAQAFELMDELLCPYSINGFDVALDIQSISIMGKAGILPGKKGDIMLASAHVMEGTANNYIVKNDLKEIDFNGDVQCYTGPMVTVLGTSLQNRAVLKRFYHSSWRAIGLEMEGGHYQRAISAAIIQGHIPPYVKTRYAYYASDNPLNSGETLASGPMGPEGIVPTYKITKVILHKILNYS